jgi:chloramphenicol-sensitive protein RarD
LKALGNISPFEVLLHRVTWLAAFLIVLLTFQRSWLPLLRTAKSPRTALTFAVSAALLSMNWFLYIWAINASRVVDASLGYFINPLVNVLLGVVALKEQLRRTQWLAVGLAATGLLWLTALAGQVPWLGVALGLSFGVYGLIRKTAALGSLQGLAVETFLLFPFAVLGFCWLLLHDGISFGRSSTSVTLLLAFSGPITGVPLLLFAAGARRIPLSLVGILQYIGPTLQLLLGIFVWREPFGPAKLAGYGLVWSALALYSLEGLHAARQRRVASDAAPAA